MKKAIRHGDLALLVVDKLPTGLTAATSRTLMQGIHGNNHDVKQGGTFYPQDDGQFVLGYLKAKAGCQLVHPDHGDEKGATRIADIPAGVYELRRQFEHKHESMTQVID